jgi:hypothetical protein
MAQYIEVTWIHEAESDPILLLSEVDEERYETRKVEVFRDGSLNYAGCVGSTGATFLGEFPIPDIVEINLDGQFSAKEVTREEFEEWWKRATAAEAN